MKYVKPYSIWQLTFYCNEMISHKINVKQVLMAQIFLLNKFEFLGQGVWFIWMKWRPAMFGWHSGISHWARLQPNHYLPALSVWSTRLLTLNIISLSKTSFCIIKGVSGRKTIKYFWYLKNKIGCCSEYRNSGLHQIWIHIWLKWCRHSITSL